MNAEEKEALLFAEKDRINEVFKQIAHSLSEKFFAQSREQDELSAIAGGDVLQQVLDHTRVLLDAQKCALFLVDVTGKSLVLERVSGAVEAERLKDVATYDLRDTDSRGGGVTPWVLERQIPFNARNFDELVHNSEGHWKGNWDIAMYGGSEQARSSFQCVYMVPLLAGAKGIGVLKYENRTSSTRFFGPEDERIIDMIASLVTNLVISQRIERNRYDTILPAISTTIVSYFDQPRKYDELLEQCRLILSADICSLFIADDQGDLMLRSIVGVDEEKRVALGKFGYTDYQSATGLTPWILLRDAPFNVRSYPDLINRSEGHHKGQWDQIVYEGIPDRLFKSLYSVPLRIGDDQIGVLKVENKNVPPYYFTESDERLFDLIGRLIGFHIKFERARETEQWMANMATAAEIGFLAAGVSHEFNNYLQRFLSTARAAQKRCDQVEVSGKLQQIADDVDEAKKIIENFKMSRNREEGLKCVDLVELIQQIISTSRQRFTEYGVGISFETNGVGIVCINPAHVQTIVVNLLQNAFESVLETDRPGKVRVVARLGQDSQVLIEVQDSGKGIPEEDRETIFAPFHSTKGGMGMGLFWARRLVTNMRGRIDVDSPNALGGATFRVMVPGPSGGKR
jgi:signal transduction histidine kinase